MAEAKKPDEQTTTLTAAMRLVTAMMLEHDQFNLQDQQEPIDCDALHDMINAAQKLLVKYCPIV